MSRFSITMEAGARFVLDSLDRMWGGEIFVPKLPSYKITDIATAIDPKCTHKVVGIRPGEKMHEAMITETDALSTIECDSYFAILPTRKKWSDEEYTQKCKGEKCAPGFEYISNTNDKWLSVSDLKDLIQKNVIDQAT